MITIDNIKQLKQTLQEQNGKVGFVPTMGALHDGHISLIKKAREENDIVVVSIFVNPTQFLVGEDLDKYPRKIEADSKICNLCGVDILFMPDINTMYVKDEVLIKAPKTKGFVLEGLKRPGHFDGMLQIVLKLFNIVKPTNAYFGKKDAQQLSLIHQMVENLFLDINIVPCDIKRDSNGLALSSRNTYLNSDEKELALNISQALRSASNMVAKDILEVKTITNHIYQLLSQMDVEYVAIVNRNFEFVEQQIQLKNCIILVAVQIGTTRLIDNIWI